MIKKVLQFLVKNILQIIYCAIILIALIPLDSGQINNSYIMYKLAPCYILGLVCVILFYSKKIENHKNIAISTILPVITNILGIIGTIYFLYYEGLIKQYTYIESVLAACAASFTGQITAIIIYGKKNG